MPKWRVKHLIAVEHHILEMKFYLPILCAMLCFNAPLPADTLTSSNNIASAGASSSKPTITFVNKSGKLISDAEIDRTNDGVSLVWEKDGGATAGIVRLEDLPPDLQERFHYDPAKTAAADELEKQKRAQWAQAVATQQAAVAAQLAAAKTNHPPVTNSVAAIAPTNPPQPVQKPAPTRRYVRPRIIITHYGY
jgi:hypothetical protein